MKKKMLENNVLKRNSFFMYLSCSMHLEHVVSKRLNIIYITVVMISTLH